MTPEEIRKRRVELGLTQDELGRMCGLNRDSISKLEKGTRAAGGMYARHFLPLARALKVEPDELLRGNEGESKRIGPRVGRWSEKGD